MTHQHFASGLAERLGDHLARAPRTDDAGARVVHRKRDLREIELGIVARDVFDRRQLEWNAQLLPDLLGSFSEPLWCCAKDEITGGEEQAYLHLAPPLGVEGRPSIDGAVRPCRPQLRVNAAVAVRAAHAARLVARRRARIARAVRVDETHARAELSQVIRRPGAECAGTDDDDIGGPGCLPRSGSAERRTGRRRNDALQKAAAVHTHAGDFTPVTDVSPMGTLVPRLN
jgi:hypothetical protein